MKRPKKIIRIVVPPPKEVIGHTDHITGSGPHSDKRTRRDRTRTDKDRRAVKESEDE